MSILHKPHPWGKPRRWIRIENRRYRAQQHVAESAYEQPTLSPTKESVQELDIEHPHLARVTAETLRARELNQPTVPWRQFEAEREAQRKRRVGE